MGQGFEVLFFQAWFQLEKVIQLYNEFLSADLNISPGLATLNKYTFPSQAVHSICTKITVNSIEWSSCTWFMNIRYFGTLLITLCLWMTLQQFRHHFATKHSLDARCHWEIFVHFPCYFWVWIAPSFTTIRTIHEIFKTTGRANPKNNTIVHTTIIHFCWNYELLCQRQSLRIWMRKLIPIWKNKFSQQKR